MIFNKKYSGKAKPAANLQLLVNKLHSEVNNRISTIALLSLAIKDENTPETEKESFMVTIHKFAHELECVDFLVKEQHPYMHTILQDIRSK